MRFKKTALSIDVKYIFSYLFILMIPMLGIIGSSSFFLRMYSNSLLDYNEALSRQIQGEIEASLGMVEQFSMDISRKQQVRNLLGVTELGPQNLYDIGQFIRESQKTYAVNKYIYDYWFIQQFAKGDYANIKDALNSVNRKKLVSVSSPSRGSDSSMLFYLQSTQIETNGKFANIVFVLDMERILSQANQMNFFETGFFCIESMDGQLIYQHNLPDKNLLLRDRTERGLIQVDETKGWTVSTLQSGRFRWTYYLGIPMDSFVSQLEMMKLLCFAVVVLTLVVGIVLSLYFMKVNAKPLDDLSDILKGYMSGDMQVSKNALQNIRTCSLSMIERNQKFQDIIEKQLPIVRNNLLNRLLWHGPDRELLSSLKEVGVSFWFSSFYVLKIRTDAGLHLSAAPSQTMEWLLLHLLPQELKCQCFFAEVDPCHHALILNFDVPEGDSPPSGTLPPESMKALAETFLAEMKPYTESGQIGISQCFRDSGELPHFFSQAETALETAVCAKLKCCLFSDVVFECEDPVFSRAEQEQWLGEIAAGKSEPAKARIRDIVRRRLWNLPYCPDLMERRIHDFREAAAGSLRSINDSRRKKILPDEQLESCLSCGDPDILESRILELLNLFCGYISGNEPQKSQSVYIDQVAAYVRENYMDPGLSLAQAAEMFNLSYTYLAHIFKDEMGCSFMDYVRKVRMENVVRLFAGSSRNISEIARDVGYSDINAFNRNFKKVMLMTPTEYRKQMRSAQVTS